jgi:hypothetical protein
MVMDGGAYMLPDGHPFLHVYPSYYWSSTTTTIDPNGGAAWVINFGDGEMRGSHKVLGVSYQWCVRGGYGHDAY